MIRVLDNTEVNQVKLGERTHQATTNQCRTLKRLEYVYLAGGIKGDDGVVGVFKSQRQQ